MRIKQIRFAKTRIIADLFYSLLQTSYVLIFRRNISSVEKKYCLALCSLGTPDFIEMDPVLLIKRSYGTYNPNANLVLPTKHSYGMIFTRNLYFILQHQFQQSKLFAIFLPQL